LKDPFIPLNIDPRKFHDKIEKIIAELGEECSKRSEDLKE
jgi:hypothetical protein